MLDKNIVCQVTTKPNPHSYPIVIERNILANLLIWISKFYSGKQIVIITDTNVNKLYVKKIQLSLKKTHKVLSLVIKPGEKSKNSKVKEDLELKMLKDKFDRDTLCVAIGGGVVGDLTGFLSATYMRGIKYIQVPTTLLSMVDSSIGGKTSIDTKYGKNLIGAIWQPEVVLIDSACLKTLPNNQLINGLFEAIKTFLIYDKDSFNYLKRNLTRILFKNESVITAIIKKSVQVKADVVSKDEREDNLRAILNFGHTIGHAIELLNNYKILHGFAVAIGMLVEAKISQIMGVLSKDNYEQLVKLLARLGITSKLIQNLEIKDVIKAMLRDKKNKDNKIHSVLLSDIGSVYIKNGKYTHHLSKSVIIQAFKELKEPHK